MLLPSVPQPCASEEPYLAPGLRDAGLIEAALARPQSGFYAERIEEAAALWESLTMNHGFIDGNKRVGFAAAYVFLRINGITIKASSKAALKFIISALEDGTFNKQALDNWLRKLRCTRAACSL